MAIDLELEFAALRRLYGIDCPTSHCRANAVGTGRAHIQAGGSEGRTCLFIEFYCPDCGDKFATHTPSMDALEREIMATTKERRNEVVAAWVTPRLGNCKP